MVTLQEAMASPAAGVMLAVSGVAVATTLPLPGLTSVMVGGWLPVVVGGGVGGVG
jgi:hypothetical protein